MNARNAQLVAAGLGFVLVVLVGAVIFILLSRPPQGPRVSPSASASARVSPSFSALPTFSFSPFPTPTLLPTASPSPSAPPTPVITPDITVPPPPTLPPPPTAPPPPPATPTPPAPPTAPPVAVTAPRELRVTGLGLDARTVIGSVERFVLFTTDGPSIIRIELSNATARSRVCLWRGIDIAARVCDTFRNGVLEQAVFDIAPVQWTLSLIGANETSVPTVDLTLDFNANVPSVEFQNLRYQGTPTPQYNGLMYSIDTLGTGQLSLNGTFDEGQTHHYHAIISEAGLGPVRDETSAEPVASFLVAQDVTAETSYLVELRNPNPLTEPTPVFLHLVIGWP